MKVYLAGKVSKNGWRGNVLHRLGAIQERRPSSLSEDVFSLHPEEEWEWGVGEKMVLGIHDYTGPNFISCDHGCAHGRNSHGAGIEDVYGCVENSSVPITRKRVADLCKEAIKQSDMVFAWIDTVTAYGTLVEIGYAAALGIDIVIGVPHSFVNDMDDMWFSKELAIETIVEEYPEMALRKALFKSPIKQLLTHRKMDLHDAIMFGSSGADPLHAAWHCEHDVRCMHEFLHVIGMPAASGLDIDTMWDIGKKLPTLAEATKRISNR